MAGYNNGTYPCFVVNVLLGENEWDLVMDGPHTCWLFPRISAKKGVWLGCDDESVFFAKQIVTVVKDSRRFCTSETGDFRGHYQAPYIFDILLLTSHGLSCFHGFKLLAFLRSSLIFFSLDSGLELVQSTSLDFTLLKLSR